MTGRRAALSTVLSPRLAGVRFGPKSEKRMHPLLKNAHHAFCDAFKSARAFGELVVPHGTRLPKAQLDSFSKDFPPKGRKALSLAKPLRLLFAEDFRMIPDHNAFDGLLIAFGSILLTLERSSFEPEGFSREAHRKLRFKHSRIRLSDIDSDFEYVSRILDWAEAITVAVKFGDQWGDDWSEKLLAAAAAGAKVDGQAQAITKIIDRWKQLHKEDVPRPELTQEEITNYLSREHELDTESALKLNISALADILHKDYCKRNGKIPNEAAEENVPEYVTTDMIASFIKRSKKTFMNWIKEDAKAPLPDIEGSGGKRHEWDWVKIKPWLEDKTGRKMPARFPGVHPNGN